MTFNPLAGKIVKEITPYLRETFTGEKLSVCELGNQTFTAQSTVGEHASTKDFYYWLGFKEYIALDINSKMDADIVDLNLVFDAKRKFYLVTNNGTGEHIFNQAAVFENCHNLCIENGLILHILPFINWINHGFYNFNPILFLDLAAANNYEIIKFFIGNRWGDTRGINTEYEYYKPKTKPTNLFKNIKIARGLGPHSDDQFPNLSIVVVFRKKKDQDFRIPLQGKYKKDIEDASRLAHNYT